MSSVDQRRNSGQPLKRETLFAVMTPEDIELIRLLVSFRARTATITQLVPGQHTDAAARRFYSHSGMRPPGGPPGLPEHVFSNKYRSLTGRLNLNLLSTEFADLRTLGYSFERALMTPYREYRRKIGFTAVDGINDILFEHWYVLALGIETRQSRLHRCSSCGSRNLLSAHATASSIGCVFCDLIEIAAPTIKPKRRDLSVQPSTKAA